MGDRKEVGFECRREVAANGLLEIGRKERGGRLSTLVVLFSHALDKCHPSFESEGTSSSSTANLRHSLWAHVALRSVDYPSVPVSFFSLLSYDAEALAKNRIKSSGIESNSIPIRIVLDDAFSQQRCHRSSVFFSNQTAAGIPGDGRCLFRSVAHGACLKAGKPSPCESLQKELADDLRAKVVDEFIKRRADTEWFLEGDFDTYIGKMRQPHIWGGEPELLMSCHVLQTPIAVYMHDKKSGKLKVIAEYGQEYGKENPIRVLYHGYGHYDAIQASRNGSVTKSFKKR